jgi:hypothetical protein
MSCSRVFWCVPTTLSFIRSNAGATGVKTIADSLMVPSKMPGNASSKHCLLAFTLASSSVRVCSLGQTHIVENT